LHSNIFLFTFVTSLKLKAGGNSLNSARKKMRTTHTTDFESAKNLVEKTVLTINEKFAELLPILNIIIKDYSSNWVEISSKNNTPNPIYNKCVMVEGGFLEYKKNEFVDQFFKKVSLIDGQLFKVNVMSGTSIIPFEIDLISHIEMIINRYKKIFNDFPEYKLGDLDVDNKIKNFIINYEN